MNQLNWNKSLQVLQKVVYKLVQHLSVGNSVDQFFFDEWQSCFDVDTSWLQKNLFKFLAFQFWENFLTCVGVAGGSWASFGLRERVKARIAPTSTTMTPTKMMGATGL